ncbi:MAG: hypothetical protein DHS20C02_16720 [Micavibrio sp.]|nr:MAG: hypothetical protein DHS20C02_16720 [Micavibrio sp.]
MVRPSNLQGNQFSGLYGAVAKFIENKHFSRFITFVILVNAVTLGLETDVGMVERFGSVLTIIDSVALVIFVIEICLKLTVYRLSFFRAGWNVFDFIIVTIALLPAIGPLSVLRTLRVLRVLRLVSVVPQMRRVIAALFHAIPGMASIIAVLFIIFYVASVLVTKLFGPSFEEMFGSIGASMYTLFQIMTLEGWSEEVVRPVMKVYPSSWIFFIPFIIVTSFAVLNLFIGIIVDAMNYVHDKEEIEVDKEIQGIKKEMKAIRKLLEEK